eukprot:31229-Pelagococcus_subviridis.AAC.9
MSSKNVSTTICVSSNKNTILAELDDAIALRDLDREALQPGDVRREPSEGFSPAAAHADEQRVSSRLHQHPVHAAHVHQRVFEQHQVHGAVPGLQGVVLELLREDVFEFFHLRHGFVRRFVHVHAHERHERRALAVEGLEQGLPRGVQVARELLVELVAQPRLVVVVPHAIAEDAEALVAPQLQQVLFAVVVLPRRLHDALDHLREVARVEQVVRLRGRGQQLLRDGRVQLDRRLRDGIPQRFQLVVKRGQFVVQERGVNAVQLRVRGVRHVERRKHGHDPLREGVAAASGRRHRRHELDVLDVLDLALLAVVPEAVVRPELQQFERRHEPKLRLLRHVEIVDVHEHLLPARGREHPFGALLELALDRVLQRVGRRLRAEVDHHRRLALRERLEARLRHGSRGGVELKGVRSGVERRSAFTTRTRSYGEQCDATPTCATIVFPTPTLPMINTCRCTPASASATVFVRSVSIVGTMILKKGIPGGGRYCASLLANGVHSRFFGHTKYSYTVSGGGNRESTSRRNESKIFLDSPSTDAPTDHMRQ